VGLDRDAAALATAAVRARDEGVHDVRLLRADMAALPVHAGGCDGVICMWQSFGHFHAKGNRRVLGQMHDAVREGGRVVIDVYNRSFHERHLGTRTMHRGDSLVVEERSLHQGRLRVQLLYDRGVSPADRDEFEWTLYDSSELAALGREVGLSVILACSGFDETHRITPNDSRMQIVFERVEHG
jgi:SAM-dependent methyltransferase